MDNSGQEERYCPICKGETDQQFTVVEKNNSHTKIFYNCLNCFEFEETTEEP